MPKHQLSGKVAIITGAASGIGRATALLLASEGAAVVITDVNEAGGQAVAAEIIHNGGRSAFEPGDVTRAADCRRVTERALHDFSGSRHSVQQCWDYSPGFDIGTQLKPTGIG